MIYVECRPDGILVESLRTHGREAIVHDVKGKNGVLEQLSRGQGSKAVVDEDPLSVQPRYLLRIRMLHNVPELGLRVLHDTMTANHVVILCPRLEDWVLAAAREQGIRVSRFGLPDSPALLHRVINADLRKFQRLVKALQQSRRLVQLREFLAL